MSLGSIGIKNYALTPNNNVQITSCDICGKSVGRLHLQCPICQKIVGLNCCSEILLNNYITNMKWLSPYAGHRVCLDHFPKQVTASKRYYDTLFAEIFGSDK